ncbi:MAG TPA: hypothetical protein VGM94_00865 [Galbitalea sp.]|jgi:hypothetical protein
MNLVTSHQLDDYITTPDDIGDALVELHEAGVTMEQLIAHLQDQLGASGDTCTPLAAEVWIGRRLQIFRPVENLTAERAMEIAKSVRDTHGWDSLCTNAERDSIRAAWRICPGHWCQYNVIVEISVGGIVFKDGQPVLVDPKEAVGAQSS